MRVGNVVSQGVRDEARGVGVCRPQRDWVDEWRHREGGVRRDNGGYCIGDASRGSGAGASGGGR